MAEIVTILSVLMVLSIATCAEFPSNIQKCHYGDSECIRDTASNIIENFTGGVKAINLESIDPLFYEKVDLKRTNGGFNLQLNLRNMTVYGFSRAKIAHVEGFTKDPTNLYIHYTLDKIKVIGDYKMRGQILLFPMSGQGKFNCTMQNWEFHWNATVKLVKEDNEKYLKFLKYKTEFTTTRMYFYFHNLFDGDKALGNSANEFFNQNWKLFYDEMKPLMFRFGGKFFSSLVMQPFSKIPYKDLFLED